MSETTGEGPNPPESPVDPAEQGNYEGVSGGETTPQSGDPATQAAREGESTTSSGTVDAEE